MARLTPSHPATSYGYDERGRRLTMVDAIGNAGGGAQAAQHTTAWGYDNDDRVVSMTDAEGKMTAYTYDKIGRLLTVLYPGITQPESRTWNPDGTVATLTDQNGSIASFSYDPDDQPNRIAFTPGSQVVGVTQETYLYDKLGRLKNGASNAGVGGTTHTTVRSFDMMDRLLSENQDGKTQTFKYDSMGNPLESVYPTSGRKFSRSFDGIDRLLSVQDTTAAARTIRSMEYFGASRLKKESFGPVDQTYAWDQGRRLTSITTNNRVTSTQLAKFLYGWADDDLPVTVQREHEVSRGEAFLHDEDHRLRLAELSKANPTGPPDIGSSAPNRQRFDLGAVHERSHETLVLVLRN